MNNELFGLGRTWLMALILIVGAFVMLGIDKVGTDTFLYLVTLAFGGGATKSTVVGAMSATKKE